MSSTDPSATATLDESSHLISVGNYPTYSAAATRGLVILAMGLPYWLNPSESGFALQIESAAELDVREQLRRFERESAGWPPAPVMLPSTIRRRDLVLPLIWSLVIFTVFRAEQRHPALIALGALDRAEIFRQHEWWRLGTALFLHADASHLVSNTLSGIFVFSAVSGTLGLVRGWLLLALSAMLGNFLAALGASSPGYVSIGASTAIFAALGLLTGRAVAAANATPSRASTIFTPLAAGITVLALYGAGGQHIDVGAHLCGFIAGSTLGWVSEKLRAG